MLLPDRNLSIGIVDPDPFSRVAVARLLLAHGYQARSFVSFLDYETDVDAGRPAAVLLADVGEYLKVDAARRRRIFQGSAVVVLDDEVRIERAGRALGAGCADYLVRPVPSTLLLHVLARAANEAHTR